ncbi:deoxyribonuclease V [Pseudoxanthomonas sacheonensis]|uniref:Endonuclease V n=1 Tax=Pseudoxanthomonas sacheonensis TaxID=443615 RepID=A0ABU1RU77_9GAMM|nr:deoxyribonuclease V [Pseudoxanthomonas sacheonensis]MDR6842321.1 deoxyribonuclease V [Pseudoxanthomonas sacheonensis]
MTLHPQTGVFGDWDGSIIAARSLQSELAQRVSLRDDFPEPQVLAGFDVGFEEDGAVTRAAVVLLDATTLQPIESHIARVATSMPYVPGLLSFRELPALMAALAMLTRTPELVFVDGQGIAHPRRLGIAAHFGVATGLPAIGVAKKVLAGRHDEPGPTPGDRAALMHRGEQIGWALRSKLRCNPLIVSPGHRISLDTAVGWVMRTLKGYRLPEPTRLADRIASRRGELATSVAAAIDKDSLF